MYEPYEEGKKFKISLEGLKNKFKEKAKNLKNFKYSKQAMTVIAIAVLLFIGGITGYFTYTSRITEISSKVTILERQITACQDNATSCHSSLQDVGGKLSDCQTSNQNCETNLQDTMSNLETCNGENEELSGSLQELESSVSDWETKYNTLNEDYDIVQSEHQEMECNYAKKVCGSVGMNYYYVKDDMTIICCITSEPDYCVERPNTEVTIKEITC